MEQNNENILSEETIGFIRKCYVHLNQARQGVWAFADLAEIVWNPKIQKKNKELYFSIIHDAIAYEIVKYEEILEMSELKNDFLAFYSKFVSKINTSHEYTNFLEDRITTLENRFGLVWKEQEEQLLKIVSEDEIILGVGKFLINKEYEFINESKDKKKKFIKNKEAQQFTLTRKRGDSFLYFCKELNQLFLLYSVQNKINVYSFVENHYTKYYPILVKKGDNFGFGNVRDNLLIEGDNYFALQLLQFTHRGKIDVIYIDPPYNTGNGDFKYNDSYVGSDDGSRHSKWLSFMDKRLNLARELLSETGAIFISIDDNEFSHLKCLADIIFGEKNFVGKILYKKQGGGKADSKFLSSNHEYIFVYVKNYERASFNKKIGNKEHYDKVDEKGRYYRLQPLAFASLSYTSSLDYEITTPNGEIIIPGGNVEERNKRLNGEHSEKDWRWRVSKKEFEQRLSEGRIIFKKDKKGRPSVQEIVFKPDDDLENIPYDDYFDLVTNRSATNELKNLFNGKKVFSYPKPTKLIYHLLKIATNKNSIILDFFAGSGTLGQATLQLNFEDNGNRKFILCTNNENNICEDITYSRLDRINDPFKFNLDIVNINYGLNYLQIKHISDLDLESADDVGNFEYVKHINNVKFSATKTIKENDYIYITDTYSVFKKSNKNKQQEYCEFFEQSIRENITNLVFVSSDRSEYDYFRKVTSDYISTLKESPLFEKIRYYQMSKNYMDNMLSIINGEEEIDIEKYMNDEENQENGEQ